MRNQFLTITTILVVGTASVSAYAFYTSPNKTVALLGVPSEIPTNPKSQVAGASTLNLIPKDIPFLADSEVLSYSKTSNGYQLTSTRNAPLFQTTRDFINLLKLESWEELDTLVSNQIYHISAQKGKISLKTKIFRDQSNQTLITLTYTP